MKQYRIILKDFETNRIYLDWVEVPAGPPEEMAAPACTPEPPQRVLAPSPAHQCTFEYRRGWRRWLGWIAPEWVVLTCKCGKLRRIMKPGRC